MNLLIIIFRIEIYLILIQLIRGLILLVLWRNRRSISLIIISLGHLLLLLLVNRVTIRELN
jgi:hypothetical protein